MTISAIPFKEVLTLYRKRQPDGKWFEADTMRFFGTVLPTLAIQHDDGRIFFHTRETNPGRETRYSVRVLLVNGFIKTVGKFHSIDTETEAWNATVAAAFPSEE